MYIVIDNHSCDTIELNFESVYAQIQQWQTIDQTMNEEEEEESTTSVATRKESRGCNVLDYDLNFAYFYTKIYYTAVSSTAQILFTPTSFHGILI